MSQKRAHDSEGADMPRKTAASDDVDVFNALSKAVRKHKTQKAIRIMSEYNLSPNVKLPLGMRPLMLCANADNVEFAKWLVLNGAKPDKLFMGATALTFACRVNSPRVAQYLAQAGASLNPPCPAYPALVEAARSGHDMIVYALLAAGANKDVRDAYDGRTALMYARDRGHTAVIRLLE